MTKLHDAKPSTAGIGKAASLPRIGQANNYRSHTNLKPALVRRRVEESLPVLQPTRMRQNADDGEGEFVQEYAPKKRLDDDLLRPCPLGCGRRFGEDAIEKHMKICETVFTSHRSVYDSKKYRWKKEFKK